MKAKMIVTRMHDKHERERSHDDHPCALDHRRRTMTKRARFTQCVQMITGESHAGNDRQGDVAGEETPVKQYAGLAMGEAVPKKENE